MVLFSKRVVVPGDVLFRDVDGEAVLLNLKDEQYFGLDPVGTRIWTVLTASPSIQTAFDNLVEEYDVIPEQLEQDLRSLIDTLVEHGLIELHDT